MVKLLLIMFVVIKLVQYEQEYITRCPKIVLNSASPGRLDIAFKLS